MGSWLGMLQPSVLFLAPENRSDPLGATGPIRICSSQLSVHLPRLPTTLGPVVPTVTASFLGEGSPTRIDYRKEGTNFF